MRVPDGESTKESTNEESSEDRLKIDEIAGDEEIGNVRNMLRTM